MELESKITILEHETRKVSEDVSSMKRSLADIASAMNQLAILEEKHQNAYDAIKRSHNRIDDQEERLRKVELSTAGSLWMERVVWISVATAINYFLSSGV